MWQSHWIGAARCPRERSMSQLEQGRLSCTLWSSASSRYHDGKISLLHWNAISKWWWYMWLRGLSMGASCLLVVVVSDVWRRQEKMMMDREEWVAVIGRQADTSVKMLPSPSLSYNQVKPTIPQVAGTWAWKVLGERWCEQEATTTTRLFHLHFATDHDASSNQQLNVHNLAIWAQFTLFWLFLHSSKSLVSHTRGKSPAWNCARPSSREPNNMHTRR